MPFSLYYSSKGKELKVPLSLQEIFDRSLKTQVKDYRHFHSYSMGDIIVLSGTSSAGKTSIIRALKQLEPDRIDLAYMKTTLRILEKKFPKELAEIKQAVYLEDIVSVVFRQESAWKLNSSALQQAAVKVLSKEILKELTFSYEEMHNEKQQMFDEAFESSRKGKNIILDVILPEEFLIHSGNRNFRGPIRNILVYCPLKDLPKRIQKRNSEAQRIGHFRDIRRPAKFISQFIELYTRKVSEEKESLEKISGNQGLAIIRETMQLEKKFRTISEKEEDSFRIRFLRNFNLNSKDSVTEVVPRYKNYTSIINTSTYSPVESAEILAKGTCTRTFPTQEASETN